jgi:hypothetical protein
MSNSASASEVSKHSGARPARLHARGHKPQESSRGLLIGGGAFLVMALSALVLVGAWRAGAPGTSSTSDNDLRTARITRDENGTCAQQVFDNQTGRMMRSSQPCEATTYDSNGMPVPVGTIHRLDAISKGFGNR